MLICQVPLIGITHAEDDMDKYILALLKDRIALGTTVGIAVGIIDEKGSRVIACGHTRNGPNAPLVDGNTFFEIGSVTKTFTGTLLADAVNRGELHVNDPISKYLPATVKVP